MSTQKKKEKTWANLHFLSTTMHLPWNFDHPSEGVVAQREQAYQEEEGGHIILFLLLCLWLYLEFEPTTSR